MARYGLFRASKRWFGGGGKASTPGPANLNGQQPNYAALPVEAQMRRLGDLMFMLGDYENAFSTYHNLRKDLSSDRAWKHYAGVQVC